MVVEGVDSWWIRLDGTLKGMDHISHQTGSLETHRLKMRNFLGGYSLVPWRVDR